MASSGIQIRRAANSDMDLIKDMLSELERDDGPSYLPEVIGCWVTEDPGGIYIAQDATGVVALAATTFPAEGEAWLQGMRVLRRARRRRVALELTEMQIKQACCQGARVIRLATSYDNFAAQKLVETVGFERKRQWIVASFELTGHSGGQRPLIADGALRRQALRFADSRRYALSCSWPIPWTVISYRAAVHGLMSGREDGRWLLIWPGEHEPEMVCHAGVFDDDGERYVLIDLIATVAPAARANELAAGLLSVAKEIASGTDAERIMVSVPQRSFAPVRRAARELCMIADCKQWPLYVYEFKPRDVC